MTTNLYNGETVIGDHTPLLSLMAEPLSDGAVRARGLIPRNYETHPVGCYGSAIPFSALDMPVIPEAEWRDRIADMVATNSRLSDIRMTGNYGQMIPSTDQNGKGYCWAHSTTSCVMLLRARMNAPYVGLSAYAIACIIKNFRDEGGWGAQSLDFATTRGIPSYEFWAAQSMSRSNDNPNTWANAALHKVTEGFVDLQAALYDRKMAFAQAITCLLCRTPVIYDLNWWGHSVAGMDPVDGAQERPYTRAESGKLLTLTEFDLVWGMNDPITAGIGVRIWNSWGDSWKANGMDVLTGNKAIPDGGAAPRVTLATAA